MADFQKNNSPQLLLRRSILLQLEAASPASLPMETLLLGVNLAGFDCDLKSLSAIIDYLSEKNLVSTVVSKISAAHLRVKLTADGRDYLESGDF